MAKLPVKVSARLSKEVPKFQKILSAAKDRDVNEADTVTIISDMLGTVFGFDKYNEITREFAIQGTYCDLAIKVDGKVEYLIEVKAIGLDLKDNHLRQAINYGAKQGIQWVVLTNGVCWEIYRISVRDKVTHEKMAEFNFLDLRSRKAEDQATLYMLCKGGVSKNLIEELYEHRKSVNKFNIAAVTLSIAPVIRRELRKLHPGLKVTEDEIIEILETEVLKREVTETEAAKNIRKSVNRSLARKKAVKKK